MSGSSIRNKLSKSLKDSLNSKRAEQLRLELQDVAKVNIVFLEDLNFIFDTISRLKTDGKLTNFRMPKIPDNALEEAQKKAREYHDRIIKRLEGRGERKEILDKLKARDKNTFDKLGKSAFLVTNFDSATRLKKQIVNLVLKNVNEDIRKLIRESIDKGHGAGEGASIAYTAAAEIVASARLTEKEEKALSRFIISNLKSSGFDLTDLDKSDIKDIVFDWDKIVSKKTRKVKDEYIPYVTFQDYYTNQVTDQIREKKVLKLIRQWVVGNIKAKHLAELKGSPTLYDRVATVAISPIIDLKIKSKSMRKTTKVSKNYRLKESELSSRGSAKSSNTRNKRGNPIAKSKSRTALVMPERKQASKGFNQLKMIKFINEALPTTVRKNMQFPSLENRTGTFSESVKVLNIEATPKGFPSIAYTYNKLPYQIFEVGMGRAPWATPERDPRKLIDKSIREVAVEYMTGRFYTRRV